MKHHYIPEFYTKRWAGPDGQVCQFARVPDGVAATRRAPAAIGFQEDLYSVPGAPSYVSAHLEGHFFRVTDNDAAVALDALLNGQLNQLTERLKSAWVRFLMSLLHRTPEKVRWYGNVWKGMHAEAVEAARKDIIQNNGDMAQLANLEESFAISFVGVLQKIMDSTLIGQHVVNMRWGVITLHENQRLMTSDRPLLITNGLEKPETEIHLPISPAHLFVAANKEDVLQKIAKIHARELSSELNHYVVSQAENYVYSEDDSQLRFVRNRLGRQPSQFVAPANLLAKYPRE